LQTKLDYDKAVPVADVAALHSISVGAQWGAASAKIYEVLIYDLSKVDQPLESVRKTIGKWFGAYISNI